jgi:hypothetical protein
MLRNLRDSLTQVFKRVFSLQYYIFKYNLLTFKFKSMKPDGLFEENEQKSTPIEETGVWKVVKSLYVSFLRNLVVDKVKKSPTKIDDHVLSLLDKLFDYEEKS